MRSKLRSGLLCSLLLFLTHASTAQPAPQTPAQPPPAQPAKPRITQERDTGGDAFSIEPFYWFTRYSSPPSLRLGKIGAVGENTSGNLDLGGQSRHGEGLLLTFPTGSENSLQASYFRVRGGGNTTAPQDLTLFGNPFLKGDLLNTSYNLQNFKISWNYLTYPHPSNGARIRIKTLWEFQYVSVKPRVEAPFDENAIGSGDGKSIFMPTLGLGLESHLGKRVYLEFKGSGFGLLHRSAIWDAEGSAVFRSGPLELLLGGKAFHYKTSPRDNQYLIDTVWGPYVGLRWILK